jgi:hypothetical protein
MFQKKEKANLFKCLCREGGQALIIVLVLLLLGSLTLPPILSHIGTALKSRQVYQPKVNEQYAADAGIEEGIWRIKYDCLGSDYSPYDFETGWTYETGSVNNLAAGETIQNVWIPSNVTLDELGLSAAEAQSIIESEKLVVSGTAGTIPGAPYRIKIDFTPATGDNLTIKSLGVWLPHGFSYVMGSSTMEQVSPFEEYYSVPTVSPHCGGQAIVWSFSPSPYYPNFTSFPGVDLEASPMSANVSFGYTAAKAGDMPVAVTWVTTQMISGADDVPISWDTDTRVYKITSSAGNTEIQAFTSKRELRRMNDAMAGDYAAIGNSLMINPVNHIYTTLLPSSDSTLTSNPADADVVAAYLYWSGFLYDMTLFSDTCTSANLTNSWTNGGDWAYYSSNPYYYRGQHSGADSRRYLTMSSGIDLSAYPAGTQYEIAWKQSVASQSSIFSDSCSDLSSWTVGSPTAWSVYHPGSAYYFRGQYSSGGDPARLLTLTTGRNLSGYSAVSIAWDQWKSGTLDSGDYLYFNLSSNNGTTWSSNITAGSSANLTDSQNTFTYSIPAGYLTSGFKIRFYIAGFGSGKYCYLDNIRITPSYSSSDGLDFALYDGSTWSSNIQAFRGDIGSSLVDYSYTLPSGYTATNFKLRFYLVGNSGAGQYCNIDNIKIVARPPDTSVSFSINDQQVYLDGDGNPQAGAQPITASEASILVNTGWNGFSYACQRDVSKLVRKYPIVDGEQNHTGNAKYTVGGVAANTGEHVSYAGWSLIIVYCSPETAGHYLYLYDVFSVNLQDTDLDFDYDGQPGGDVTDFVVPEPIRDRYGVITETVAARLTAFVGEGDDWLYGSVPDTDCIKITGQQSGNSMYLSNPNSPANNVWNSYSYPGTNYVGVDIDTFEVLWSDNIFMPGDTRVHLDMYSGQDVWNLVYIILSVRSKTVTGGTEHYSIF